MIDKEFPYLEIFPLATTESWRKEIYRPIYYGHKWWARRLGSVFRFILGSALIDNFDLNKYSVSTKVKNEKVILDPFMGSGTTVGESLKFGCRTIGCDINPVSYFMVKTSLQNISKDNLLKVFSRIKKKASKKVNRFYKTKNPKTKASCDVLYFFWVATIPCPLCEEKVKLFDSYIFSKNAYPNKIPECQIVCPGCQNVGQGNYKKQEHTCSSCKYKFNPHIGIASRNNATCPICKSKFSINKAIKRTGDTWKYELYAIMFLDEYGKKQYKKPENFDFSLFKQAKNTFRKRKNPLIPEDRITPGHNTNQILNYNFQKWRQLFNERQLLTLHTLLTTIKEEKQPYRDIFLMLFSGLLEFNNMFCSFKGEGTGAVRHIFSHHILKPERMALENTVIGNGKSSGTFSNLFKSRILKLYNYLENPFELVINNEGKTSKKYLGQPINVNLVNSHKKLSRNNSNLLLFCRDSSSLPLPDKSVDYVITDPPFFDFINYSELADFFYAWIRLIKRESVFQSLSTRSKKEVQGENKQEFIEKLTSVYRECNRLLKKNGLLIFTFHHSNEEGWEAIRKAIKDSSFKVIKTYPVKSEMSVSVTKNNNGKPINLDAIIVCSKAKSGYHKTKRSSIKAEVENIKKSYKKIGYELGDGDLFVINSMKKLEYA